MSPSICKAILYCILTISTSQSGTAIIMDDARGLTSEHATYSDLDVEKLNALPETAFHRNVDIPIIEADKAGYVKAYLITPGTYIFHCAAII